MDFTGKLALVTGGASGIGAACASFIASRGGAVVVADRNAAAAEAVAAQLGQRSLVMDIGDEASVRSACAPLLAGPEVPAILINCAGVLQNPLPPDRLTMKEWDLVTGVDLRGTYLCCAIVGSAMAAAGRGAIVNIASVAGMRSQPLHAYGPAKAAVISLTECLAAEWGPRGVRVNAVSPGFTHTPALAKGMGKKVLNEEALVGASAMGRLVDASEVAAAVAFLASDLASGVTGVNLPVDAGYLVATPWASYGGLREEG